MERKESQQIVDMLNVLLASDISAEECKRSLKLDFGIRMINHEQEENGQMCN